MNKPEALKTLLTSFSKGLSKMPTPRLLLSALLLSIALLPPISAWCQAGGPAISTNEPNSEAPKDTLGRNSPRGTVLGFMTAARKGNFEVAALYLNTPLRGGDGQRLARQLAAVLDRRLPARLNQLSDEPEGSIPDPLKPDEDVVGTIPTATGDLNIVLERVDRGKMGRVWVFSRKTLESIPDAFHEITTPTIEDVLPAVLVSFRIAYIPLYQWLAIFVGMPLLYFLTGVFGTVISRTLGIARRRFLRNPEIRDPGRLPAPLRLIILAAVIRLALSNVALPLLARQFWSTAVLTITVASCVWLVLIFNGMWERYVLRHKWTLSGSPSVLRLIRRAADGLVLFASLLFSLYYFGINITAALAGLGVGGIAVALAAQKTLENAIGGISLIADQAVRVGDTLKLGDVLGTVEEVGLRSTRIRTLDRTLVSVPNGQIANMSLETLSARDKFWFHHLVSLRYETTKEQLSLVLEGIRDLLTQNGSVERESIRVRLLRLGTYSLDVDIFAYVFSLDWNHFLESQEGLLLSIIDVVERAGAHIAFPSQTTYLSGAPFSLATFSSSHPASEARSAAAGVSPRSA